MTHREPNQPNRFLDATEALMLLLLCAMPAGIIGYGAWWAGSAVAVGIGRWLT
jgi:hypothetical protein